MTSTLSPLRYPGGKASFTDFFGKVLALNGLTGGLYAEPFAGGAGAALGLLLGGHVDRIAINDADPRIHAFWKSILENNDRFVRLIETTPVTIEEWEKQRMIYLNPKGKSLLRLGFASFFLNRCNRSGIMFNAGPIGGKRQEGKWKLDARYDATRLIERITRIAEYSDRILVSCFDARRFLDSIPEIAGQDPVFVYLDPPYYVKGSLLYMNHFNHNDHAELAAYIKKSDNFSWLMTYDDVPEIRKLYSWAECKDFELLYSAYENRRGGEVLISPPSLLLPKLGGSLKII